MSGRIATVLSTVKKTEEGAKVRDVECDPGGGATITAELFQPAGVDAQPLPGDSVLVIETPGEGRGGAVACLDPENEGKADDGEHRTYARNPSKVPVCQIWQKQDGTIVIEVLEGTAPITIKSAGTVTIDSPDVRISDAAGQPIARVGDICVGQLSALTTSPGNPIAPGPPGPGVPFSAQIVSGQTKAKA